MRKIRTQIKVVNRKDDNENLIYYLGLSYKERLESLEELRTNYIRWNNSDDNKSRFQRVYTITKRK
jgi:hypothetical protein